MALCCVLIFGCLVAPPALASAPEEFGITSFTTHDLNSSGQDETQAGGHPFEANATFRFTTHTTPNGEILPLGYAGQIVTDLPPGFVGNPQAVGQCPSSAVLKAHQCPSSSLVGIVTVFNSPPQGPGAFEPQGVYNMAPEQGHPAQFAFVIVGVVTVLEASVRSGDYGVTITSVAVPQNLDITGASLTFCGYGVTLGGNFLFPTYECSAPAANVKPFLSNPTKCSGAAPVTTLTADTWEEPGNDNSDGTPDLSDPKWKSKTFTSPAVTGCEKLSFQPSIAVTPNTTAAGVPAEYQVDLKVPQTNSPQELSTPSVKETVVTLPAGTAINPAAAGGLTGCNAEGAEGINLKSALPGNCPDASKIGSIEVETPLLKEPLKGSAFVGTPDCNPCSNEDDLNGRLFKIYFEVAGSGVVVKLPGTVTADPSTGRLTATFQNLPQLPFEDLHLRLFGGPRAPLSNPTECGVVSTTTSLTPWSAPQSGPPATPSSAFAVSLDGQGAPCPATRAFGPAFSAGTAGNQGGAFSPFALTLSRNDSDQELAGLNVTLPRGALAKLAGVPLCSEAQANAGACPEGSQLGTVTVAAGAGSAPFPVTGKIYLTGPYKGGPFGEVVVVPAIAGPFNLGTVVVRGAIYVDPSTAQASVVSDPFPRILDGVPLQVRTVNVTLNRPGFTLNPTNCSAFAVNGTVRSMQGASASVSSPFAAGGCKALPFKPSLKASTAGTVSKANGASLVVKIASKGGPGTNGEEANIGKVELQVPKLLPARLTTLQKACVAAQFEANPAACPKASVVATAVAHTPLLSSPLVGPGYLVSHGGAAFPDLEFVLQGERITLVLDGKTDIKKGITYSRFETVPDAPISSFETNLPKGPYSLLAAPGGNLCGKSLSMPTTITGQNGAQLKQSTKITESGCPKAKKNVKKKSKHAKKARRAAKSSHGKGRK
jgi:hypothetical protein